MNKTYTKNDIVLKHWSLHLNALILFKLDIQLNYLSLPLPLNSRSASICCIHIWALLSLLYTMCDMHVIEINELINLFTQFNESNFINLYIASNVSLCVYVCVLVCSFTKWIVCKLKTNRCLCFTFWFHKNFSISKIA